MNHYWVNLQAFEQQRKGAFLWAPSRDKNGHHEPAYDFFQAVLIGDVIFACRNSAIVAVLIARSDAYPSLEPAELTSSADWDSIGFRAECEYNLLRDPIPVSKVVAKLRPFLPSKYSPINKKGKPNQGFFFPLTESAGRVLLDEIGEDLVSQKESAPRQALPSKVSRVLGVSSIHLCSRLLNFLTTRPQTIEELISKGDELSSRGELSQPQSYVPALAVFTVELGLAAQLDNLVSITRLGEAYVEAADATPVSAKQADLLRTKILSAPYRSQTNSAIVAMVRVLSTGERDSRMLGRALMLELGREGLAEVTQQSWLSRTLAWLRELGLASETNALTITGRAFLSALEAQHERATPEPLLDRGGFDPPKMSAYRIGTRRRAGVSSATEIDREAWRQAQERRSDSHAELLDAVACAAERNGLEFCQTQFADLIVGNTIIEVKSLEDDDIAQSRAALAQLYHYRFIHRGILPEPVLVAVFSRRPERGASDLVAFLNSCGVSVVWRTSSGFESGEEANAESISWLLS